jgi:16S rRNA G966 N2-methylase RsmD
VTLSPIHYWVFIGKGYIPKNNFNKEKINKFIYDAFNKINFKINNYFMNQYEKISKFTNKELISEINKKYIEIYKWAIKNDLPVINIYSDYKKKPELLTENYVVNYLFPNQKGVNKSEIKLFDISIYSVTPPNEAKKISDTIKNIFYGFFKYSIQQIKNLRITDGTANVGGNTINFSFNFNKVNTIEIEPNVFNALKHNCINVYQRKNISFIQGDCIKIIPTLKQDIIFIDPPWNGAFYKAYDKLHLFLGDKDIVDIVQEWYNKDLAKLYIIKCPANLDFDPFINSYTQLFIEKLRNYNIIYIVNDKKTN